VNGLDKISKTPFQRVADRFYIYQHVKFLTQNKMLVLGSASLREEASILILFFIISLSVHVPVPNLHVQPRT
jgi:hypothetical protein